MVRTTKQIFEKIESIRNLNVQGDIFLADEEWVCLSDLKKEIKKRIDECEQDRFKDDWNKGYIAGLDILYDWLCNSSEQKESSPVHNPKKKHNHLTDECEYVSGRCVLDDSLKKRILNEMVVQKKCTCPENWSYTGARKKIVTCGRCGGAL